MNECSFRRILLDKKTAILNAALKLFSEIGVHDTPMSAIAGEARTGVGTIYRYFKSKEILINSLFSEIHSRMIPYLRKDFSEKDSINENYNRYFVNLISYLIKHPVELSFISQYSSHPRDSSERQGKNDDFETDYAMIFKKAAGEGLLKNLQFEILGDMIMCMAVSIAKFYIKSGIEPDSRAVNVGAKAIWDAIKK
jgi:AcrR family transcriptional regulator